MALGDSYATVEELEAMLGKSDDGTFALLLASASRQVEAFTRRQFNQSEDAYPEERRYRALDPERLPVDDFWTLDGLLVEIDGDVWAAENVDARPWNGMVDGQTGWPFFDLFAVGRSWPIKRRATVYVSAHWGWAQVPAGIVQATLLVAKRLAESSGISGTTGVVRSEAVDGYSVSYGTSGLAAMEEAGIPPEMVPALPYRRKRFGVA